MDRIIFDIYSKGVKKLFGDDPTTPFNQKIEAVNNMYGWLYDSGILEKVSFKYEDLNDSTYFAFKTESLKPYRKEMEECQVLGAELACQHIFDEKYSPCRYSGAIELGWTMKTYREVDGTVGSSWECSLIQSLNTNGIYDVYDVLKDKGPEEAVKTMFGKYDWDRIRNTIWIGVYKDTLGVEDDYDNVTEICVPREWLKNILNSEGIDLETWRKEYTCDDTIDIAYKAEAEGVILDCSDYDVKVHIGLAIEPIYFVIQRYKDEFEHNYICTKEEIQQVLDSQAYEGYLPYYEDEPELIELSLGIINTIYVCKSAETLSECLQGFHNDLYDIFDPFDNSIIHINVPWENRFEECSKEAMDLAKKYVIACEDISEQKEILKNLNLISVRHNKQGFAKDSIKVFVENNPIAVFETNTLLQNKTKSDDEYMLDAIKHNQEKVKVLLTKSIGVQTLDEKIKAANKIIADFMNKTENEHNIERNDKEK